ncbi:hypothetical protein BS47DRAFT_489722 [Hydnum rufescens UP504]|uniref:Uncharacterized protein n=1 Tax=Hydnum rufescens UP504 TaxID=1448309 RepID=A0A9P6AJ79_9AGAM|nr:hypothetical protein BS47DRAFT_489722 [Hydnum rufescens UP504]
MEFSSPPPRYRFCPLLLPHLGAYLGASPMYSPRAFRRYCSPSPSQIPVTKPVTTSSTNLISLARLMSATRGSSRDPTPATTARKPQSLVGPSPVWSTAQPSSTQTVNTALTGGPGVRLQGGVLGTVWKPLRPRDSGYPRRDVGRYSLRFRHDALDPRLVVYAITWHWGYYKELGRFLAVLSVQCGDACVFIVAI